MLEVMDLQYAIKPKDKNKGNKDVFCLQNINFRLDKGYILGLLGLNGAGKSTLLRLIMGNLCPHSGSVALDGETDTERLLQKIAVVSDDIEFLNYRTLKENANLFGILYDDFDIDLWENYMKETGFSKTAVEFCYGDISTGEKRRFQLAFALARHPELLLLDEPTANLDPHARVQWMELLQKLVAEEETSVIIATHLTEDIDELTDYIMVLDKGKQVAFMDREEMVDRYGEIALSELLLTLVQSNSWESDIR